MKKTNSRIQLKDMTETARRLGQRELAAAELKTISAGANCQGGTTSSSGDTDE
jgi:hypothetical protein